MASVEETLNERGSRYGKFEHNAETTQRLMSVLADGKSFSKCSNQHLETFHMICHKLARIVNGDPLYSDSIHDIVGYAKLLEDFVNAQNQNARTKRDT